MTPYTIMLYALHIAGYIADLLKLNNFGNIIILIK
jgi:hypothetical protein